VAKKFTCLVYLSTCLLVYYMIIKNISQIPSDETLMKMKNLLELYASDTTELIAKYYWQRIREQRYFMYDKMKYI
jgi:hypothetical protein